MERWLLSFITGAILSLFSPVVPALFYESLLILLIIALLCQVKFRNTSCFLLGFIWLLNHAYVYQQQWQKNNIDEQPFFSQKHLGVFSVINTPVFKKSAWRFNAELLVLNGQSLTLPVNIRIALAHDQLMVHQGDIFEGKIKLKPAHGNANTGGFNYQRWLRSKNILATGYISKKAPLRILEHQPNTRTKLLANYQKLTPKHELTPLIEALTFGERSHFTEHIWQVLQDTGTQHLVAISGLHLGLVATLSLVLLRFMFRWLPLSKVKPSRLQRVMRINANTSIYLLMLAGCTFYAYLAGFSIPTLRALIMLSIFTAAKLAGIALSFTRLCLLSVTLIILLLPSSLYSESFWLSIIAVMSIAFIFWRFKHYVSHLKGMKKNVITLIFLQLSLSILMIPITAIVFSQVSMASAPANLIALPLVSFIILPLLLLSVLFVGLPEVSILLIDSALYFLEGLWRYLSWLSQLSWQGVSLSSMSVDQTSIALLSIALIGGLALLVFNAQLLGQLKVMYRRILVLVASFCMIGLLAGFHRSSQQDNRWQVYVLDVGQGLAVVIESNSKTILYDTGASYPSGYNIAEQIILPFLSAKGMSSLDYVIVSHDDNDHAGGLNYILEQFPDTSVIGNLNINVERDVERDVSSNVDRNLAKNVARKISANLITNNTKMNSSEIAPHVTRYKHLACAPESSFSWQQLQVDIVSPSNGLGDDNDDSCVVIISDKYNSVLLPGDISASVERALVKANVLSTATVLVAPHHGSKTSSSSELIDKVQPQITVFSAGFLNRWNMPNTSVIQRYQAKGSHIYTTSDDGMISVKFSGPEYSVSTYRKDIVPFWYAN